MDFPAKPLGIIQRLGKKTKLENLDVTFLDRLENLYILNAIIDQSTLLVDKAPDERDMFEVMAHHRLYDGRFLRRPGRNGDQKERSSKTSKLF